MLAGFPHASAQGFGHTFVFVRQQPVRPTVFHIYIYMYIRVSVRTSVLRESSLLEDLRAREGGTTHGHAFLGMDCVSIYTCSGTRWCEQCRGNVVLVGGRGACRRSLFFPLGRVLLGPQPRKHIAVLLHMYISTYTYA